jgi:hypothetical protein
MENETLSFGMFAFYSLRAAFVVILCGGIGWLVAGKWLMKKIEQMEIETGQQ